MSDEIAAGAKERLYLRASHADRDQVIDVLKAAFAQGRLAKDEFDLRVGQVLASRTYADLAALTADIPAGLIGAQPEPARESNGVLASKAVACMTTVGVGVSMLLSAAMMLESNSNPLLGLVAVGLVGSFVALLVAALLIFFSWAVNLSRRQSLQGTPPTTGGKASQRLASADLAGQLLRISLEPRHTLEAARSGPRHPLLSSSRTPQLWIYGGLVGVAMRPVAWR